MHSFSHIYANFQLYIFIRSVENLKGKDNTQKTPTKPNGDLDLDTFPELDTLEMPGS